MQIGLETSCSEECAALAYPLYRQLSDGDYEWPTSALPLHKPADEWLGEHRTVRKRVRRCEGLGYTFGWFYREDYADDIYAINTSLDERQGRPMSDGYLRKPEYSTEAWRCDRHRVNAYGVFDQNLALVAYAFIYRCGNLALVSQILGHGDHLNNDVMFLLLAGVYRHELDQGGVLWYNRHDSGTEGLVRFKEWFGFAPTRVGWAA